MDNRPIGIFDSGIGGLTVLEAVHRLMPQENLVYFGDSGRAPYGTKSPDTVRRYTFQDINFLLQHDVKMIVIACNTASACSLESVKKHYDFLPVQEVVEPGAAFAAECTKSGRIGVIATNATVASGVYERAVRKIMPECTVFSKACPLFVPLVEEGWFEGEVTEKVAEYYLSEIKNADVDTLILGCTHYPYLEKEISKFMGKNVRIINSGVAVAETVKKELIRRNLTCEEREHSDIRCFTSDSEEKFSALSKMFLKENLPAIYHADIEKVSEMPPLR